MAEILIYNKLKTLSKIDPEDGFWEKNSSEGGNRGKFGSISIYIFKEKNQAIYSTRI